MIWDNHTEQEKEDILKTFRKLTDTPEKTEQVCLHSLCTECHGNGKKKDNTPCIHMLSCPCPKCTPYSL